MAEGGTGGAGSGKMNDEARAERRQGERRMTISDASDEPGRWGVRFSPTIELGHILQGFIMLAGLGGWALVGYQTIDRQLAQHAADMKLYEQRQKIDEAALDQLRASAETSSVETRRSLAKLLDQIADLRTLVASQGRDVPHPR